MFSATTVAEAVDIIDVTGFLYWKPRYNFFFLEENYRLSLIILLDYNFDIYPTHFCYKIFRVDKD